LKHFTKDEESLLTAEQGLGVSNIALVRDSLYATIPDQWFKSGVNPHKGEAYRIDPETLEEAMSQSRLDTIARIGKDILDMDSYIQAFHVPSLHIG